MKDDDGNDYYVGHGKIEEVDDEADIDANNDNGDDDNDLTPRAKKSKQLSPHFSDNESHPETIPYNSTPPPGPRPRRLPSLKATTTLSEIPDFNFNSKAIEPVPTEPDIDSPRAAPAEMSPNSTGVLDDATEVSYVKENLELLESCTDDIRFMTTYFLAQEEDLSQHIDICTRIEESLRSLHETMTHRTKMGAEEWSVRSPSWHQKYSKRLVSLRTTLHRLSRLRKLIGNLKLRPSQAQAILTKLGQHDAKLADLASKYTTSFDRLRLRHLHFLLSQSNMEAKQQKEMRLKSRASFERQWKAGKDFRAGLRHAFNELRQEFYNNNQRSPSAP
ncbi:hypothetical protein CPC08DRAFT_321995 [Agrocybe pediades]|nr:hypothetical protein CPC08DRAFT_321995 [Agrocybe pediades]